MDNQQYQEVYSDVAERFEEAYSAFRRTYEMMQPPPVMPANAERVLGWKQAGMFLGLLGSVIVSASHTIPIFVGSTNITPLTIFIGIAVFVMVEVGIIVFAYSSTEQQHKTREDIRNRVKHYTRNGLYFIVTVAIAANVVYVIEHNITIPNDAVIQSTWNGVRVVIFLAVGLSAPVIAFLTGEILAVDVLEHQSRFSKNVEKYQAELAEWQDGLNRSWSSQKKKWGANIDIDSRVKRLASDASETVSSERPIGRTSGQGYAYASDASETVRTYLLDNPDDMKLSVRELAEKIGVGKSTVAAVRKQMMD